MKTAFNSLLTLRRRGRRSSAVLVIYILACVLYRVGSDSGFCDADSVSCKIGGSSQAHIRLDSGSNSRYSYLLYDVNPGEGFNLRRDVYMRIATLVHKVRRERPDDNWILVLPPWGPLYHWKRKGIGYQMQIPWGEFFDLQSLSRYVPVMEFNEFLKEHGPQIDKLYYLQHYAEGWKDGSWEERMDEQECVEQPPYEKLEDGKFHGWFWGYPETFAATFVCLSVQGRSSTLMPLLLNAAFQVIMIDRAEVILHDEFGDANYWMVRRSMRFAEKLVEYGNRFRKKYLNSTDLEDKVQQNENWLRDKPKQRTAVGGPYVAVHLRRQDFVKARPQDVPSIKHAAVQLKQKLEKFSLDVLFVSTDAPKQEVTELKGYIPGVVTLNPSTADLRELKDGGIAIVDQWICSHARYFIGTHESTFSFRIQEEREILGFRPDMTFNRLCGDNQTVCKQPSQWKIVYS